MLEVPRFQMRRFLLHLPHTWHLFVTNALLGFLVNTASFLVIKRTVRLRRSHVTPKQRLQPSSDPVPCVLAATRSPSHERSYVCRDLLRASLECRYAEVVSDCAQRPGRPCGHLPLWRPSERRAICRVLDLADLFRFVQLPADPAATVAADYHVEAAINAAARAQSGRFTDAISPDNGRLIFGVS